MSRTFRHSLLVFAAMVYLGADILFGMNPPQPGEMAAYYADGSYGQRMAYALKNGNHKPAPGLAQKANLKIARACLKARGYSSKQIARLLPNKTTMAPVNYGCPSVGSPRILAIGIEFTEYPATLTTNDIANWLFSDGDSYYYPYESLLAYYERASLNKLHFTGNVLGWYNAGARSDVPETTEGCEQLIKDALTYFDGIGHDFSQYDNDGDGKIDYIIVYWCGPDTGWGSFWWAYNAQEGFTDQTFTLDGKTLGMYTWQWDRNESQYEPDFGIMTTLHETGHAIGLPDYYDYDDMLGPKGGTGGMDMMDSAYGNHGAFSRWILDWITPVIVAAGPTTNIILDASGWVDGTNFAAVIFPGATTNYFSEFFMLENRFRTGNDTGDYPFTSDGLLAWHVDATLDDSTGTFLNDNQYTEHKLLRVLSGNGLDAIESGQWASDADLFTPGCALMYPRNLAYDGTATGVFITNVTAAGLTGSATLGFTAGDADAASFLALRMNEFFSGLQYTTIDGTPNTRLAYRGVIAGSILPSAPVNLKNVRRVELDMGAMNIVLTPDSVTHSATRNASRYVWGSGPDSRLTLNFRRDPLTGSITFKIDNRMQDFAFAAAYYHTYFDWYNDYGMFPLMDESWTLRIAIDNQVFQAPMAVDVNARRLLPPFILLGESLTVIRTSGR